MNTILLALPFGVAVGLSLGLVGAGGSLLAVPILVYVFDVGARDATTAALVIVCATAVAAAVGHARRGSVVWRTALTFGLAAAVGAVGGTALNRLVDEQVLLFAFGFLMLAAAYGLVRGRPAGTIAQARHSLPLVVALGAGVGLLTGFFGVGGGFVVVPVFVLVLGLPIEAAIGTSLVVIAIASAAALAGHVATETIDWALTGAFAGASIAGALVGARLSGRVPARALTLVFAVLVAGVGALMIVESALALA